MTQLHSSLPLDRAPRRLRQREHFVSRVTQLLTSRTDLVGVVGLADVVALGVLGNA